MKFIILAALPLAFQIAAEARQTPTAAAAGPRSAEYFETSVRPVLAANCYDTTPVEFEEFMKVIRAIEDFWLTIVALPRE